MKITEAESYYNNLENASVKDILCNINAEDKTVSIAVEKVIPQIEKLVSIIIPILRKNGRLFYIGAGTSGRLGVLDAAECFPTFGLADKIIGIIAGGKNALSEAVEGAEDDFHEGWNALKEFNVCEKDFVFGISSSGYTPYVVGALQNCNLHNIPTGSFTCNLNTPLAKESGTTIEVIVGPEFVTGSTRMKAGTATKLVLNMISTSVMLGLGRIQGNKMYDLQILNKKLHERAMGMIAEKFMISKDEAAILLANHGSVRNAINFGLKK